MAATITAAPGGGRGGRQSAPRQGPAQTAVVAAARDEAQVPDRSDNPLRVDPEQNSTSPMDQVAVAVVVRETSVTRSQPAVLLARVMAAVAAAAFLTAHHS